MKNNGFKITLIFIFFFFIQYNFCHPHLFIDYSVKFIFDDDGLSGLKIKWVFDEYFSISVINDFDLNKNGKFDKKEIQEIKNVIFKNVVNLNYYAYISIDDNIFKMEKSKNFKASIHNNRMEFEFFLFCNVKAGKDPIKLRFAMSDATIYCAITLLPNNPVTFYDSKSIKYDYNIYDRVKRKTYKKQKFLQEIIVRFWKIKCD